MRSSGCGFLEEQICHLGLDTTAGQDRETRETGRGGSRGEEEETTEGKKSRGEESAELKGTDRVWLLRWKDKTQMMTRGESKKMPVGSMQLITADSLCLDSSPWQQDGPAELASTQEDTDKEINEQTDKGESKTMLIKPDSPFHLVCLHVCCLLTLHWHYSLLEQRANLTYKIIFSALAQTDLTEQEQQERDQRKLLVIQTLLVWVVRQWSQKCLGLLWHQSLFKCSTTKWWSPVILMTVGSNIEYSILDCVYVRALLNRIDRVLFM